MATITLLYAGILGLMSIPIAFMAGSLRGKTGISVGDGGNQQLLLAMRRHANFIEFVPLGLLIIALLEANGVSGTVIHGLCGSLVLFRLCHAFGIKADTVKGAGRAIGAAGSTLVMLVASVWAVVAYF